MIVGKIEIKLQFPYKVQAQYEHRTATDNHLQNHKKMYIRTKSDVALNMAKLFMS